MSENFQKKFHFYLLANGIKPKIISWIFTGQTGVNENENEINFEMHV